VEEIEASILGGAAGVNGDLHHQDFQNERLVETKGIMARKTEEACEFVTSERNDLQRDALVP
jgi:hypothetical protein